MEFERKFIDTIELSDWQVETDSGFVDIEAIGKTVEYDIWKLTIREQPSDLESDLNELITLECADTHIVFNQFMEEIFVKDLKHGELIQTKNGTGVVISCYNTGKKVNMYDLQLPEKSDHRFYTNNILSHNSMWLQNFSAKLADAGYNVVYVTLEMAAKKVVKRLGSMRLKINSKDYDDKSKDPIFMKDRINKLLMSNNGLFQSKVGKIFIKKYPTGALTVTELDNYLTKLKQNKKIDIHAVMVDYLNLMTVEKGNEALKNNLYLKGKHLAEGLRYIGDKHQLALITATQIDKAVWGASDIDLNNIPESKAVAETADTVWGIIRNSEMKRNNLYKLKHLKQRDGECKGDQVRFNFDPNYLLMENDTLIGAV